MMYNEDDLKRAYHLGYAQADMHIPFMKDDEIISYIERFHIFGLPPIQQPGGGQS